MNNDKLDQGPNPDPEEAWESGRLLLGDFEVQRVLGQGGMGKVYLVRSRATGMEFAVKRALIKDDNSRQNFLSELQTWIDLPVHPHIAACRFFRTIGDEIAIFSEYVDGGTLADWIRIRRLVTLEQIINVAIQFAWGLHAIHEHGLIHQDVKPGNVLMTEDRLVKVTDFGLARARLRGGDGQVYSPTSTPDAQSVLLSAGGMTQAYCSPEQAAKQPLSRKTDIWSWGISVLDMFCGEISCRYGQAAGEALEDYLQAESVEEGLPRMPQELAGVLRRCFQMLPEQRWENMREVADALERLYQKSFGVICPRETPESSPHRSHIAPAHDRVAARGVQWSDPVDWLKIAFQAAGRELSDIVEPSVRHRSRRAQSVSDLAKYDEALRLFERLIVDGQTQLRGPLAKLCIEKGWIHEDTNDTSGAIALYQRAIDVYEQLVNQGGQGELVDLARAYANKAYVVEKFLGDRQTALVLNDSVIAIREQLVNEHGRHDLAYALAASYVGKADTVCDLGDPNTSLMLYDRAIEIQERLVNECGQQELAHDLAATYDNKAIAFNSLGDKRNAVALYDRAIEIRERLVNEEGQSALANYLASSYVNKALAISYMGDNENAVTLYDRAIEIRERLVATEGRHELLDVLASAYVNKAFAVRSLGDNEAAAILYDHGISIYERLVNQEARQELANELASAYMQKSQAVMGLEDKEAVLVLYDRVIEIRERLMNEAGRQEQAGDLGAVFACKAHTLHALGNNQSAAALYDRAIEIYERLVNEQGQKEMADRLGLVYMNKGNVAWDLGDNQTALTFSEFAITIYERLVNEQGRKELADDLAGAYENKANAISGLGDKKAALELYERGIQIWELLVSQNGRWTLANGLAKAYMNKAITLHALGDNQGAVTFCSHTIEIYERLINREGRRELENDLAKANEIRTRFTLHNLGDALGLMSRR